MCEQQLLSSKIIHQVQTSPEWAIYVCIKSMFSLINKFQRKRDHNKLKKGFLYKKKLEYRSIFYIAYLH